MDVRLRFPRRLRTALLVGTAFVAGAAALPAAGVLFGLHFGIPAASAQEETRSDTYRLLTLFGDVFERVRAEYVDPVSDKDLVENSINGMLTGLDPHSSYMNAKAFRDMQVQTKGEFGGLGIEVTQESGFIKVISPIDDTPAAKAGIKAGDIITAIDGKTVQGISLNDAVDRMRGPPTPRSPSPSSARASTSRSSNRCCARSSTSRSSSRGWKRTISAMSG